MEINKFSNTDGQKRKGVVLSCELCQKEFISRKDQLRRFCSKECSSLDRRKREISTCANCNIEFETKLSCQKASKSGFRFCSRACKDKAQCIGGIKEIMPPHFGTGKSSRAYRNLYRQLTQNENLCCLRCSYNEFECGIDIHHIDRDRNNNVLENLIALCAPCHRALHCGYWQYNNGIVV
jgi:hypothetical protein